MSRKRQKTPASSSSSTSLMEKQHIISPSETTPKSKLTTPQFVARVVNNMLFEISKSQLKIRMKLGLLPRSHASPNSPLLTVEDLDDGCVMRESARSGSSMGVGGGAAPPSLTSSRRSSRATLKAIELHDYLSSVLCSPTLSPSGSTTALLAAAAGRYCSHSSPNLHCLIDTAFATATRIARAVVAPPPLTDMPDAVLLCVLSYLDGDDVYRMAMTCSAIRHLAIDNSHDLAHRKVSGRELLINVDRTRADRVVFRLGRVRRSKVDAPPRETSVLEDLLPPLVNVEAKIAFGSDVIVSWLSSDLRRLFDARRLSPVSMHFTGGANTKGNHACGADLRHFTLESFIAFCAHFYPVLKEVQLATTRHFRLSHRILTLTTLVETFGCVYERPALRVDALHIEKIIRHWREDRCAHSCTLHIRRPLAEAEELCKMDDVQVDTVERNGEIMVSSLAVPHRQLHQVELLFLFH